MFGMEWWEIHCRRRAVSRSDSALSRAVDAATSDGKINLFFLPRRRRLVGRPPLHLGALLCPSGGSGFPPKIRDQRRGTHYLRAGRS